MNPIVYNLALVIGVALIGVGIGMQSIPRALVAVGVVIILLNLFTALIATRKR